MSLISYELIGILLVFCIIYYLTPVKSRLRVMCYLMLLVYMLLDFYTGIAVVVDAMIAFMGGHMVGQYHELQSVELKREGVILSKEEKAFIKKKYERKRNAVLVVCISLNILLIVLSKYVTALPIAIIGVSYFTLRSIGYMVDVNRKSVKAEKDYMKLFMYVGFIPLLFQGPLSDYQKLTDSMFGEHRFDWDNVFKGATRVAWGFFKKLVIADRVFPAVAEIVKNSDSYDGGYVLLGMALYTLELFADFTGGIDVAIGASTMFGITVQENFDRPFFQKSMKEYWRHWHITMCEWFRNYLFYPISVCAPMKALLKFTRKHFGEKAGKRIPVYLASFLVWFITGLWHGARWNFIVWALCHYLILMISEEMEPVFARFHEKCKWSNGPAYRVFQSVRTVFIASLLMQFDIFTDVGTFFKRFGSIFTGGSHYFNNFSEAVSALGLEGRDWIIIGAGVVLMIMVDALKGEGQFCDKLWKKPVIFRYIVFAGLVFAVILLGVYGPGYDSTQFIYTRF